MFASVYGPAGAEELYWNTDVGQAEFDTLVLVVAQIKARHVDIPDKKHRLFFSATWPKCLYVWSGQVYIV